MQVIGDKCYVASVKPGSDAEAKGLKAGDLVLSIDGREPVRQNLWLISYVYYSLRPQAGMRLVVQTPEGKTRQLDVMAKVKEGKKIVDLSGATGASYFDINEMEREFEDDYRAREHRYEKYGEDLFIWEMKAFDLTETGVDEMMAKAKKHKTLVLDLRGNGGGAVDTLKRLVGYFFDRDIKISDLRARKERKPMIAKTRGKDIFTGKVVVLVDSRSASCSELFARIMQLEKRGTVIGDVTAGAVMQAMVHPHQLGVDSIVPYAVYITDADLIMADGKSLEKTGVVPDELMLPKPTDLAARRDPVLAYAASLAGVKLEPEKAATLFPVEWRK
jgi:carboxyl-terminal processing protease